MMSNRDWKIGDKKLEKEFRFDHSSEAKRFIARIRKLAKTEQHRVKIDQPDGLIVRVSIPVQGPDMYEEKDVRLANLINRVSIHVVS